MPLLPVSSDPAGIPLRAAVLIIAKVLLRVAEDEGCNDDGR
jgi:hypothetical protein